MNQTYLPGTEPPDRIPEVEEALDGWLDSKVEQKRAGETTKLQHSVLVARLNEAGVERYAYTDRTTGKRRFVYPDRTPKLKTTAAPKERRRADREPDDVGDEVKVDDRVEVRTVSRASVESEIDPFAATRSGLDDRGVLGDAEEWMANGQTPSLDPPKAKKRRGATT